MSNRAFSLCIPFHTDQGARERIFHWTLARWHALCPDAEIVIGADTSEGALFNISRARNQAAQQATTDTLVFVDADAFLSTPESLTRTISLLPAVGMAQFSSITWCNQMLTRAMLADCDPARMREDYLCPEQQRRDYELHGLFFALTRQHYEHVNGFDEHFSDYGEEDRAFRCAILTLVGRIARIPNTIYHLWHPRGTDQDQRAPSLQANHARLQRYRAAHGRPDLMRALIG